MSNHLIYVLNRTESEFWRRGNRGIMGAILRNVTTRVREYGASRFSLYDAEENLLMRIPVDGAAWADAPKSYGED